MIDIRNTYKPSVLEAWLKETREAGFYVSAELVSLHNDPQLGTDLVLGFRFAETPRALSARRQSPIYIKNSEIKTTCLSNVTSGKLSVIKKAGRKKNAYPKE